MTILKSLLTSSLMAACCLTPLQSLAITRSSLYLPNENFCAVYQGSIHNEHKFVLWVNQEDRLTIQANNDLQVAVTNQGKIITPYQVGAATKPMIAQWFYHTKLQQKHTILVKGNTSQANIRLCLH